MSASLQKCIITTGNDHYRIVGPFPSDSARVAWGYRWQTDNNDDPRWQCIDLADPDAMPTRVRP